MAVPVGALTRYQVMVEGRGIPDLAAWGQSATAAAAAYRELIADLLHGGLTGVVLHGLLSRVATRSRPVQAPALSRVVIVGGGFGGVSAARRFERLALRGAAIDVTVISDSNFLLFTSMLAEVASSAVEPSHICAPVRAAATHTRFRHAAAEHVDTDGHAVRVAAGAGPAEWIPSDHLVLAVGSVPHFLDLPGVEEHARTLKDLTDANQLRNQVIGLLERADHLEPDSQERERLLTFVVAGGGFAGTEMIAELFDLVHGVLHYYAVLFRRASFDLASGIGWGVSCGFLWWVLGNLTLLPLLTGGSLTWNAAGIAAGFPSLVGHLGYGAALGLVYLRLESRADPWWFTRSEVEAERAAARGEQTLGSAPALWGLTVLIAVTVPVLVGAG